MTKKWVDVLKSLNTTYDNTASSLSSKNVQDAIDELKSNSDSQDTDLTTHTDDTTIHYVQGDISHANIQNIGTNTHIQIDTHIGDATIHFTEASIDKYTQAEVNALLSDKADESDLSSHTGDLTIHFTETSIDHTNIQNIGSNTHAQIDSHISDGTIHFAEGDISHTSIQDVGINTHVQIDTHISDATIHFTEASIDKYTQAEVDALLDEKANDTDLTSHTGDLTIHFTESSINHVNIQNVGTNTHAQIDTHIGDITVHFTEASINHVNIQNVGTNTHVQIDSHISDSTIHFVEGDISHTNIQDIGTNTHAQIDSHIGDTTIHFTETSINHENIQNIGANTHPEIDQTLSNHAQSLINLQTGKEAVLDVVLNDGLGLIGYEDGTRKWEMVVKNHSDETDYVIDDIVNYFGHLYTCIVNHDAQVFDPDQWRVTVNPIGFGIQMTYDWNGSALSGDPGSGFMGTNNVDPSLATTLYISDMTEPGNIGEFVWIAAQVGDVIGYEEVAKDHENAYFRVTGSSIDGANYTQIPVEYIAGTGTPDNNKKGIASYTNDPANRMPSGGLTNQSLVKSTDGDYDTIWQYMLNNVVNVGTGAGNAASVSEGTLNLKSFVAGESITITEEAETITINAEAGGITTVTLTGDVTGTSDASGNITTVVVDDSHNHIIGNVTGLQTALDNKADDAVFSTTADGLVPQSVTSNTTDFLRRDGTWAEAGGGAASGDIPSARYRSSVGQSADSATPIAIQWNQLGYQDNSFNHSTVTNNTRIPVTIDGTYYIFGRINYVGSTNNGRFSAEVTIRINGSTVMDEVFSGGYVRPDPPETGIFFGLPVKLTAGQYIEILSAKTSSGTTNTTVLAGTNLSLVHLTGAQGPEGPPGQDGADYASQAEVDAGTLTGKSLSPKTFNDSAQLDDKADLSGAKFTGNVSYNNNPSGGATINCSLANSFSRTVTGNITYNFTNIPTVGVIIVKLYDAGDYTVGWSGATFKWLGGEAPTFTSNGDDVVVFYTYNGNTLYQSANVGYA